MADSPQAASTTTPPSDRWRLAWLLLGIAVVMFALLYSVIQPPTALPDETAFMRYAAFLASTHHLPVWTPGGGEAGYESQHAPLGMVPQAIVYGLTGGLLPENMRWLAVRFAMAALSLLMFPVMAALSRRLYPEDTAARYALVATVVLMPLALNYWTFADMYGPTLLLSACSLLLAARIRGDARESPAMPYLGGLVGACGALINLVVAGLALPALVAQWLRPGQTPADRIRRCGIIAGTWLIGGGWWYVRNQILYGSPFTHNPGPQGTGYQLALGPEHLFTLSRFARTEWYMGWETYLSFWAQRGWFPVEAEPVFIVLLTASVLLALAGLLWKGNRRATADSEPPANSVVATERLMIALSALFLLAGIGMIHIGFWSQDVEFNGGGRYLLPALPAFAILLVSGIRQWKPGLMRWFTPFWVITLLAMNITSAYHIIDVLVPKYYPGWRMFEFPSNVTPPPPQ